MFKTRYTVPGEAPGVLKVHKEVPNQAPVITLIEYDAKFLEERVVSDSRDSWDRFRFLALRERENGVLPDAIARIVA